MPIITLTSDWGIKDHYVAAVKGSIYKLLPDACIVDISHDIPAFDLNQAAFIIRNFYHDFPEGSIHILGINTEASIETPHTIVFQDGHYFIGADNGIFSLIFDKTPEKIIEIDVIQDTDYFTFPTRDVFVKVACHIASGKPLEEMGRPKTSVVRKMSFQPVIDGNLIKGKVIYVDNYENVFTNITDSFLKCHLKGKKFAITFRSAGYRITSLSKSYKDVVEGEMLALISAYGHLEIAINQGKASSLLGLKIDQPVLIEIL
ncbi:MAG TPA: SAM-dependent chlorinase/fluorinase [Bacteroidales bacterium]|nr:SAM-dependent chlorinase/fluorinase [Bacteroidales bacterium]